jgi:signal transduction histidine kinase
VRSAAWRISLWGTLAFACGTLIIFIFLHNFVAKDIQRRSDVWLSGEVETLSDVAERTPKNALYGRVVEEIAELASHEIPDRLRSSSGQNDSVFFVQTTAAGSLQLWAGAGNGAEYLKAIQKVNAAPDTPFDIHLPRSDVPFRVAMVSVPDGSHVYLGMSERDELRVLGKMRAHFLKLWVLNVLLGFAIIFFTTRRMLGDVRRISEAAGSIGESDLSKRVPTSRRNDEVAQLARTLNRMLARIEESVHQLHTITNSLAHDLRSPLTAIRARLEIALTGGDQGAESESSESIESVESIECAINEIDRLTEILNQSLDVAEARAGALRLEPVAIDLEELLRVMIELYQPSMNEKGLRLKFRSAGPVEVMADAALLHRMLANLFDNEIKHLLPSRSLTIVLSHGEKMAQLVLEDDGPGFAPEIKANLFKPHVKGQDSHGRGWGLAFVHAVARAHGGSITAENREEGGARITVQLPLATDVQTMRASMETTAV